MKKLTKLIDKTYMEIYKDLDKDFSEEVDPSLKEDVSDRLEYILGEDLWVGLRNKLHFSIYS